MSYFFYTNKEGKVLDLQYRFKEKMRFFYMLTQSETY